MSTGTPPSHWDEGTSQAYLDYGKYFIPAREQQMKIMVVLLGAISQPGQVLELCCGEGLLAEQILQAYPHLHYHGLDGSPLMLTKAVQRLSPFTGRVQLEAFDLVENTWRKLDSPFQAVISSLAIHHLDGAGKQKLFSDVYTMLDQGGAFIIADMVEPASDAGRRLAADAWDEVVYQRSMQLDGNLAGLDFFQEQQWNTYRYPDPEDIDHPSPLFDQLRWLEQAGFVDVEVHFFLAGHAVFSAWKLSKLG